MKLTENQPKGLFLLFFVEMWERFSYYGMRALLVLYMWKVLQFSQEQASHIYGWYTGMVYLTPLLGGYIADRYLGQRKAILIGGLLMAIGEFCMASTHLPIFFTALILIIIGNGFFKPNISTIVGTLYTPEQNALRDAGFTIFYMGINIGAFFSPLVCGTIGEKIGFNYGFICAGVGMLIGLAWYLIQQEKLLGDNCKKPAKPSYNFGMPVGMVTALLIFLVLCAMQFSGYHIKEAIPAWVYAILGVAAIGYGIHSMLKGPSTLTTVEKQRIAVIFIMTFFCIFFWAAFEQAGSSLTFFAEEETNRVISLGSWSWEMPTSYFQAVNPLLIVLLAPLFSSMWLKLKDMNKEPSAPIKFAMGLGMLAIGFVVMIAAAALAAPDADGNINKVGIFWLIFAYMFHTMGELCLSPIGLSLITKLAPAQFTSLMMGIWFLSSCAANFIGGFFAGNYKEMNHSVFFTIPTATAAVSAVLLLLLTPRINKWMNGVK